jgi:hypothetical protein
MQNRHRPTSQRLVIMQCQSSWNQHQHVRIQWPEKNNMKAHTIVFKLSLTGKYRAPEGRQQQRLAQHVGEVDLHIHLGCSISTSRWATPAHYPRAQQPRLTRKKRKQRGMTFPCVDALLSSHGCGHREAHLMRAWSRRRSARCGGGFWSGGEEAVVALGALRGAGGEVRLWE